VTDADVVTSTDQRQPEQFWVALNPCQQLGIRELQVLESGVYITLARAVEQSGQSETINESLDFGGSHWFLLQIDYLNRYAALFEKALGGASRLRVLDAEDLHSGHMARFWQTYSTELAGPNDWFGRFVQVLYRG